MDPLDLFVKAVSGPEPVFDPVLHDFLLNGRDALLARCRPGGLLEVASLGENVPWVYRLTFRSRGLARADDGEIKVVDRHVVALRFFPDYLRKADRFAMLGLVEPRNAFHPNLSPPGICLEIYPGEPVLEIVESLHALFSWRLRQLRDDDALNKAACAWGRAHLADLPIDRRPLFGRGFKLNLEPVEGQS
jgi:hypothetical protein